MDRYQRKNLIADKSFNFCETQDMALNRFNLAIRNYQCAVAYFIMLKEIFPIAILLRKEAKLESGRQDSSFDDTLLLTMRDEEEK